ncbi:MAG: hypothetical protein GF388_07525 [Candidatus Aegiribacteria sp.]|nr:hypothetical protein [Candidatus Aegiribacteria sp.]MBD3294974.1 hypothetical protein [Candidatus Fermentibacteria bacterium]
MIIAGCAEKERYPERYLDSLSLVLHTGRAAQVSGLLRQGASPGNALEYPDLTGTSRISFYCSRDDSMELLDVLPKTSLPIRLQRTEDDEPARIEYWQEGLFWKPIYGWTVRGDSCRFFARAQISNRTGREWFSRNTSLTGAEGTAVCMVPDTLIVRCGDMELGWWSASGELLPLTLSYGWPLDSQWNQMLPCVVENTDNIVLCNAEYPMLRGDTLWIPPEQELEVFEEVVQNSTGYHCTLQIHNQTDFPRTVRIAHPERTPRGALFQPEEEFPEQLNLQPGDLVVLKYHIVYRR